jgi:DNA modification methylase
MLINGNCLEEMKNIEDNSVDLIFCDLPYGQTSCKWDCCIDLNLFWKEIMRIKILNAPIIMTTTTKFGVSLIQSAPKKCPFRYDLIWCKSASCGFLSSSRMPLRKHEMIYVFYEKLPFYDLSSHKHKFIKERDTQQKNGNIYEGDGNNKKIMEGKYDPPLPTSLIKEEKHDWVIPQNTELYGKAPTENNVKLGGHQKRYDPPLPTSLIKEGNNVIDGPAYNTKNRKTPITREPPNKYNPPLPNSLLEIKSTRGKHSTEKPVQLMEWVLKYYSKEGDTVLDPTMGSGSTGVACKNMNRKFIGIEMDKDIYDGAVKRLE